MLSGTYTIQHSKACLLRNLKQMAAPYVFAFVSLQSLVILLVFYWISCGLAREINMLTLWRADL